MQNQLFFLSACILLFGACAVIPVEAPRQKVEALSKLLSVIQPKSSFSESLKLSRDIFHKIQTLTRDFELTSPPLWHNTLVNLGFREKGLCYHWSDALYVHLLAEDYPSFEFHLFGANIGEYLGEHNALVVMKKGGKVEEGVVIDPWRDSGKLYFSKVKDDRKYIWSHRKERGCNTTLR